MKTTNDNGRITQRRLAGRRKSALWWPTATALALAATTLTTAPAPALSVHTTRGATTGPAGAAATETTVSPFDGTFTGGGLTLHLQSDAFDPSGKRFIGSLVDTGHSYPVELRMRSSTVLAGSYLAQAVEHLLVVTRSGRDLTVIRSGVRLTLRRIDAADDSAVRERLASSFESTAPLGGGVAAPLINTGLSGSLMAGGITLPGSTIGGLGGDADTATTANGAVPAFVRLGVRMTYETSSSSTPPDGSDNDPTGSVGYEQLTITGIQSGIAAVESRLLAIDLSARAVWNVSSDTILLPLTAGGEYWASPRKLATMKDGTVSDVTTVHGPYTLNGKTYSAVRITTPTDGGFTQYTFDVDSGMLLIWGLETKGNDGTKIIAQKRFVAMRQTAYPWANQKPGAAVLGMRSADWSGTYGISIQDTYDGTYPLAQHWAVTRTDGMTVQMNETTTLDMRDGRGPQATTVLKTRPIPSLWIDPNVLAKLRKGQVIDDDRVTGLRTTVSGVSNGMLVMTETGAIQVTSSGFDLRTGMLVAVQSQHRNGLTTTTAYLKRRM